MRESVILVQTFSNHALFFVKVHPFCSIAFIAINQKYFKNHTYQTQNHHFKPLQEAGERCNTPNRKYGSSHPTHTGKYSHFQQFHVFFLWHFKEKVKYQF